MYNWIKDNTRNTCCILQPLASKLRLHGLSGGGGQRGEFAPGTQFKGAPKFEKLEKNFGTFFDINNGVRKNF
jgi:hypothetical protein